MDTNAIVISPEEVPTGFKLVKSEKDPGFAVRVYSKSRGFLRFADAIWSEAALMPDEETAVEGWEQVVRFHKRRRDYQNVEELDVSFGDQSYVHSGTMRGRPGLWAAVRIGIVVHRFNTYGVTAADSLVMLRRQLARQQG